MNILKLVCLLVVAALIFSGCQDNNGDAPVAPAPTDIAPINPEKDINSSNIIYLPVKTVVVTNNNEAVSILVKFFDKDNLAYEGGSIKVAYSDDAITRDAGAFAENSVELDNGAASFEYTAPNDIVSNTSDIVFYFFHEDDVNNKEKFTLKLVPNPGQRVYNSYIIDSSITSNELMRPEEKKIFSIYIKDQNGIQVKDEDVTFIQVKSINKSVGELLSSDSTPITDEYDEREGANNISVNVKAKIAGLLRLEVKAKFKDANGDETELKETFNIVVHLGELSAMSLNYVRTIIFDKDGINEGTKRATNMHGKIVEHWALSVATKYQHIGDKQPKVSMGMMVGFAKSNGVENDADYLFYPTGNINGAVDINGTIDPSDNTLSVPSGEPFKNIEKGVGDIVENDYLVTFAKDYTYDASGKWDIDNFIDNKIWLKDDYKGQLTSGLGFAVGRNHRDQRCSDTGDKARATVFPSDLNTTYKYSNPDTSGKRNYALGKDGHMDIYIEFDPYLVGKTGMLWVNVEGINYGTGIKKLGRATKTTLRGDGLEAETVQYSSGTTEVTMKVFVKNSPNSYSNGYFYYTVKLSNPKDTYDFIADSRSNYLNCSDKYGAAYVKIKVSSDEGGTATLENLVVAEEF